MIKETKTGAVTVGGQTVKYGYLDLEKLRENKDSFKDPTSGNQYPFATVVNDNKHNFYQLAYLEERTDTWKCIGRYYKIDETSPESLFDGTDYECGNVSIGEGGKEGGDGADDDDGTGGDGKGDEGSWGYGNTASEILASVPSGTVALLAQVYTGTIEDGTRTQTWQNIVVKGTDGSGYVIMDRNLGATEAGPGCQTDGCRDLTFGNLYQWGNNYGFTNTGYDLSNISSTLVSTAERPYFSGTFIRGSTSYRYDWVQTKNNDLWGGSGDTLTTNGPGTNIDRQGPCPSGYHVPSIAEWGGVIYSYFHDIKGESSYSLGDDYFGNSTHIASFLADNYLPSAGKRNRDSGYLNYQGSYGLYWSSSPNNTYARYLYFYSDDVYPQSYDSRSVGFSVRCFKN